MQSQNNYTQITLYYLNGQTESFRIQAAPDTNVTQQELQQEIRRLLDRPWWIMQLPEQTVCVSMANVLKVEFKPPMPELHGEGVFTDVQLVTPLTRAHN